LESRKTLYLNLVSKVITVDLVSAFSRYRVWLGLYAGAHFTGIVGGGQSARARPGLGFGYTQIRRRRALPPSSAVGMTISERRAGGEHVEGFAEPDNTVDYSGRTVLECGCGERLILLGLKENWLSEQRTYFECQCGQRLTWANRLDEDVVLEFKQIMRGAFKTPGG
jgi:hypothetical protein